MWSGLSPFQWQHEDALGSNNQPLSASIPPRSVTLGNMKKKLYKLSQDEGAIVAIQVLRRSGSFIALVGSEASFAYVNKPFQRGGVWRGTGASRVPFRTCLV